MARYISFELQTNCKLRKHLTRPGVVVHVCNPSTWETDAGGSKVQSQAILHRKTLSQKKKKKKIYIYIYIYKTQRIMIKKKMKKMIFFSIRFS
jgi:hypothetical protein